MDKKIDIRTVAAILISIAIQVILWPVFMSVFSLDSTILILVCIVLLCGGVGIAIPYFWYNKFKEEEFFDVLNMPLVVAQGFVMAFPLLTCSDWDYCVKLRVLLIVFAVIIYVINVVQIVCVMPEEYSLWMKIKAFLVPGLFAFAIASIAAIIIAVIFALSSGKKKRR